MGRLCVAVEPGGQALLETLARRQAVSSVGGGEAGARSLLTEGSAAEFRTLARHHSALREVAVGDGADTERVLRALSDARLEGVVSSAVEAGLREAFSTERRYSTIIRAAIVAGCIAAPAPASRDAQRAASLAADLVLCGGGVTPAAFGAPVQLDAATRSAAVQVERSGAWLDWMRAWCMLLAREARATERAVRATLARFAAEHSEASAQHRIGATDAVVLSRVHATSTFTIGEASAALGLSAPTVGTSIERIEAMGFATELTGQRRDRIWTSTASLTLTTTR